MARPDSFLVLASCCINKSSPILFSGAAFHGSMVSQVPGLFGGAGFKRAGHGLSTTCKVLSGSL